jgi:hypothetical protein
VGGRAVVGEWHALEEYGKQKQKNETKNKNKNKSQGRYMGD